MPRVRKIQREPNPEKNYYIVDACFLVNKYIPTKVAPNKKERVRIEKCLDWWDEIDSQLGSGNARVYIPDVCIAEAFKVLAKKYYSHKWFKTSQSYAAARTKLSRDITTSTKELKKKNRDILYHDISTTRDIIISVDRFYELFLKSKNNVQLPDLILVATAKYLMDFYDIKRDYLHIVTLDGGLWRGSKKIQELPNAYDPVQNGDLAEKVFM